MHTLRFTGLSVALIFLGCSGLGCSGSPKPPKVKEPEPDLAPVTGRTAFYQSYPLARNWAADAQPLQVVCLVTQDSPSVEGKCGLWRTVFVSPSRGRSRMFTWSTTTRNERVTRGVSAATEEPYGGGGAAEPFLVAALRVDTDKALETARKQPRTAEFEKTQPNVPVTYLLEKTRFPSPAWRVIWGETVAASQYSVYVDASTGTVLQTTR